MCELRAAKLWICSHRLLYVRSSGFCMLELWRFPLRMRYLFELSEHGVLELSEFRMSELRRDDDAGTNRATSGPRIGIPAGSGGARRTPASGKNDRLGNI